MTTGAAAEELSPAFAALVPLVERLTGRTFRSNSFISYAAPKGEINTPNNDVEGLLHEFCHWVVAGRRRDLDNYGLDSDFPTISGDDEERMCGWIEDDLYARAGVERPYSSVDENRYRQFPGLRRVALRRFRKAVGWQDRLALVECLRLPGGDLGLFPA